MAREIGDGKSIVRGVVNKIGGEGAADRVASTVSQFGLQNTGGAGANKHTNALRTIFADRGMYRIDKTILQKPQQSETIVAAIEVTQMRGQLHCIHARDLTHVSGQIHAIKRAGYETGATLAQRRQGLIETAADATACSEM